MLTVLGHSARLLHVSLGLDELRPQVLGPLEQSLLGYVALTLSLVKPRRHLTVAGFQLIIGLPEDLQLLLKTRDGRLGLSQIPLTLFPLRLGPFGSLFPLLDLVTQVLRQGWQVHSDRQKVPIGRHMNVGHRPSPLSWGRACLSRHAEDALEAEGMERGSIRGVFASLPSQGQVGERPAPGPIGRRPKGFGSAIVTRLRSSLDPHTA